MEGKKGCGYVGGLVGGGGKNFFCFLKMLVLTLHQLPPAVYLGGIIFSNVIYFFDLIFQPSIHLEIHLGFIILDNLTNDQIE